MRVVFSCLQICTFNNIDENPEASIYKFYVLQAELGVLHIYYIIYYVPGEM